MASRFLGLGDIYADTNPIEDIKAAMAAKPAPLQAWYPVDAYVSLRGPNLVVPAPPAPLHGWCPVDAYVGFLKHPSLDGFTNAQVDERIRDLLADTGWPADVQAALLDEWRTTGKMGGVMVYVSSEEGVSLEMVVVEQEGSGE